MADQESQLSLTKTSQQQDQYNLIPETKKYDYQNYRVYRHHKLPPIDITENMAEKVFREILNGRQAVVLGKSLVMCGSIASIDPLPIKKKPVKGRIINNVWTVEAEK